MGKRITEIYLKNSVKATGKSARRGFETSVCGILRVSDVYLWIRRAVRGVGCKGQVGEFSPLFPHPNEVSEKKGDAKNEVK